MEDVKNQILTNDIVASMFMKDPNKQGVAEDYLYKYFKSQLNCENVLKNRDSLYNFSFSYKNNTFVVFHKYINNTGGSQSTSYLDFVHRITDFLKNSQVDTNVLVVVGGTFFSKDKVDNLHRTTIKHKTICSKIVTCRASELDNIFI